jgi:hypothetical protein
MTLAAELAQARALFRSGHTVESIAAFERAVRSYPESAVAHGSFALALWELGRIDDAETEALEALRLDPECAPGHCARGLIAEHHHDPTQALVHFEAAVVHRPDFVLALTHAAVCAALLGDHERALAHFETALRVAPAHPQARLGRALQLLRDGRYQEGWLEYEWRLETGSVLRAAIPRPRWGGSNLAGRRILVLAEPGIGDTVQFVRFLTLLKDQGASVAFACRPDMTALFAQTSGIDRWFPIDQSAATDFDAYVPIGSLPGLLGIDERSLPRDVPYVFPDPARVARWEARVAPLRGFKVGIGWQGSPTFDSDRYRSVPLRHFASLLRVDGVHLVSLQKHDGEADLDATPTVRPVTVLDGLDDNGGVMADTAAVMQHLDLVITSDTAIAHLAGAMNVPVWVTLSTASDWRWLRERSDSPWYPSMRLFRQTSLGDWDGVFARVADALELVVGGKEPFVIPRSPALATAAVEIAVGAGELFDKISVLRLKVARITDTAKVDAARHELDQLEAVRLASAPRSDELEHLVSELDQVNARLWDIENALRDCERRRDFGPAFVDLARETYLTNDRRAALKAELNALLGSPIVEVKSYASD